MRTPWNSCPDSTPQPADLSERVSTGTCQYGVGVFNAEALKTIHPLSLLFFILDASPRVNRYYLIFFLLGLIRIVTNPASTNFCKSLRVNSCLPCSFFDK